jgi:hypothetical protein
MGAIFPLVAGSGICLMCRLKAVLVSNRYPPALTKARDPSIHYALLMTGGRLMIFIEEESRRDARLFSAVKTG